LFLGSKGGAWAPNEPPLNPPQHTHMMVTANPAYIYTYLLPKELFTGLKDTLKKVGDQSSVN